MQELISYVTKTIVQHPDSVQITSVAGEDDNSISLRLTVHPEDMGVVIGKEGKVARALRSLAKAMAIKNGQKAYVDIVELEQD